MSNSSQPDEFQPDLQNQCDIISLQKATELGYPQTILRYFTLSSNLNMMIWKPNVTVAAVIEQNGKYLLVEEEPEPGTGLFLNQPAGHLDPGESILQGAIRETLEETAYTFIPEFLLGVYQWHSQRVDMTYLRFAFVGRVTAHDPERILDHGITRADWFDLQEIERRIDRHRSPLVMCCIQDHRAGKRYPLELLTHYDA